MLIEIHKLILLFLSFPANDHSFFGKSVFKLFYYWFLHMYMFHIRWSTTWRS